MKRSCVVLSLTTFLAWTWPAYAATVVIVAPPAPSAEVTEALTLLRGELLSVGLDVATGRRPTDERPGPDSRRWLEDLAAGGASAVVDAVEVDAGLAVDVWVVRMRPLRFEVTRVAVDPDTPKAAEVLSLRAVEALRAGLLLVDRAARTPQARAVMPAGAETGAVEPHGGLALDAGALAIASLGGVGPSVSPMLRLSWAVRPWLVAQASLAGAGTRPTMTSAAGSALVAQQYATLGAGYRLRPRERLWPFFTLAAGAVHTSVEGQTSATTDGHTAAQWALLLEVSSGVGLRLSRRWFMTLAAHVQLAEPYVIIHIGDDAATTGRPNLGLGLTVGAWL
jgi:hypothetical protein